MIAYKYFIDTAPYIYCLEGDNSLSNKTKEFFKEIYISNANFTTSSITYEEYLVHPYKNKDYECIKMKVLRNVQQKSERNIHRLERWMRCN